LSQGQCHRRESKMSKANNSVLNEGLELARSKWSKYINAVVEGYKRTHKGNAPEPNLLATTAVMLENTKGMIQKMDETTRVVNLGNFVDYGFGIITALMPSLVANEIVSVQPLKARSGEIFFLDFRYGSTKGNIQAGSSMISPITGSGSDTTYSSESVSGETLGVFGAAQTVLNGNLSYLPVAPGTVKLSDGTNNFVDNGVGGITGTGLNTAQSSVNYATGAVKLTYNSAPANGTNVIGTYNFQYTNQDVDSTIPEVNIELTSQTITTVARKLRARWLFDAAFELQQTHGIDADAELSTALASEVRHEIDGEIMNDLLASANAGGVQFSWSKVPSANVAMIDWKDTFVDTLIRMSNAIFQDTKRAEGNFLVAGINVCSVIESLGGRFVPDTTGPKAGPHLVGVLDGRWKIYKNPFYPTNEFLVGYKGQSYLEGGYVYAPYLPLYTTPTIMLDDFVNRKGVATRYGKKMLNTHFYCKGIMTNTVAGEIKENIIP
jgi:hypothetical protein